MAKQRYTTQIGHRRSVAMTPEQHDLLSELAFKAGLSVREFLRVLLSEFLERPRRRSTK